MELGRRIGTIIGGIKEAKHQRTEVAAARRRHAELCLDARPTPEAQSWTVFDAEMGLTAICSTPEEKMRRNNPSPERIADLLTPVKNLQK
jgi:hypothetical protein